MTMKNINLDKYFCYFNVFVLVFRIILLIDLIYIKLLKHKIFIKIKKLKLIKRNDKIIMEIFRDLI